MTDSLSPDQGQGQLVGQVVMYEDLAEIEKKFEDVEVGLRTFMHFIRSYAHHKIQLLSCPIIP